MAATTVFFTNFCMRNVLIMQIFAAEKLKELYECSRNLMKSLVSWHEAKFRNLQKVSCEILHWDKVKQYVYGTIKIRCMISLPNKNTFCRILFGFGPMAEYPLLLLWAYHWITASSEHWLILTMYIICIIIFSSIKLIALLTTVGVWVIKRNVFFKYPQKLLLC